MIASPEGGGLDADDLGGEARIFGFAPLPGVAAGTAPEFAAREAISYLHNRLGGHGGIILLGPDGRFGMAHNTPAMAWGLATEKGLETGLKI